MLEYKVEIKKPKVPFGNLIESGMIEVEQKLFSQNKKFEAVVNVDSSISYKDIVGSIHKVSANIENKISSNVWSYWSIEDGKKLQNIDEIRESYSNKFIVPKTINNIFSNTSTE